MKMKDKPFVVGDIWRIDAGICIAVDDKFVRLTWNEVRKIIKLAFEDKNYSILLAESI